MGLTPQDFFVKAHFESVPAVVLLLAAAWYARSVRLLTRRGRPWATGRTASFAGAWLIVAVASFSGLYAFDPGNFSAFAAQYTMVGLVAPALVALSAPLSLAVQSPDRTGPARWLEGRVLRCVTHPFVTWALFSATVLVLFFTRGLLRASLDDGLVQQAVMVWVLLVGCLFFLPVANVDPLPVRLDYWPRILYLLLTIPVFTIVGMSLESEGTRLSGRLSLDSLQLGGAVVWVAANGVAICGAIIIFVQWLRADERRAKSQDVVNEAAAAKQLALWRESREDAARAAR
jgi:cytochrome c oxidase assembly factor CtaG